MDVIWSTLPAAHSGCSVGEKLRAVFCKGFISPPPRGLWAPLFLKEEPKGKSGQSRQNAKPTQSCLQLQSYTNVVMSLSHNLHTKRYTFTLLHLHNLHKGDGKMCSRLASRILMSSGRVMNSCNSLYFSFRSSKARFMLA